MTPGLRQAAAFLTPIGGAAAPTPEALRWFPAVGAMIGAAVGGAWWVAGRWWPAPVAAAVAVAVDLGLTGMLHLDGLCDAADGLLPPLPAGRRLEVMAAPDVGAFAVGTAVAVLITRWAALAVLSPAPLLTAGLWAASRTWMAGAAGAMPYARPGGLASAFLGAGRSTAVAVAAGGLVAAALLAAGWRPAVGPVSLLVGTAGAACVLALAWRRVGGFTGDVLGAAGMVGETVGLLAASAKW